MANKAGGDNSLRSISKIEKEVDYQKRINRMRAVIALVLLASFIVFCVIVGLAILNEGVGRFVSTIESVNVYYYFLSLIVVFAAYLMRFPKWELYLKRLGVRISWRKSFAVYFSMYSMDITPGRWGRAVVSYTLNKITGKRFGVTFPAVVADIFTDFLGFACLALISVFFVGGRYIISSIVITILLLIPFIFMYHRRPFEFVKKKLSRFSFMRKFFEVGDMYFENNKKLGGDVYAYSLAYTIPSMLLNSIAFYMVILAFGIHLNLLYLPLVIFIFTSSTLFGMITGIPGNVGVADAALLGYLVTFLGGAGITFGVAVAITIFTRLANLWFVEGFGYTALHYTFNYWKK